MNNLSNYSPGSDNADAPWNAVENDEYGYDDDPDFEDEDVCDECGFEECECLEEDEDDE